MFKFDLLNDFIVTYSHLPDQGTDKWKLLRRGFIGGSEIAYVLKKNKNKSANKLVMEKLGFDKFTGNVITHWGNVFEEMIRLHCEESFSCTIRETGSIPYKEGYLSYSPDGLAVVPTHKLLEKFGPTSVTASTQLVLFEFKCPHSRVPTTDIPECYLPQVSIGMNIIDIMETAVFVQATYRRCAFTELKYNKRHNPYGHFKAADLTKNPIECGFMVINADEPSEYVDGLVDTLTEVGDAAEIHLINGKTVVDLGTIRDTSILEEVLGNCVTKAFKVDYCFRRGYDQAVFTSDKYTIGMYDQSLLHQARKKLRIQTDKHPNIVCVMPFKLLSLCMTPVYKNQNYIQETEALVKAKRVLDCISNHACMADKAEVAKSVRKYKL